MIRIPALEKVRRWATGQPAELAEQLARFESSADRTFAELARGLPARYDPALTGVNAAAFWGVQLSVDTTLGSVVVFLPKANPDDRAKTLLLIKKVSANTMTLQPVSGLINGAASLGKTSVGLYVVSFDGENYWVT